MLKDYSGYVCRQTLKNIKTDGSFINSVDGYRVRSVFASTLFNIILFERRVFSRKKATHFYILHKVNVNNENIHVFRDI